MLTKDENKQKSIYKRKDHWSNNCVQYPDQPLNYNLLCITPSENNNNNTLPDAK